MIRSGASGLKPQRGLNLSKSSPRLRTIFTKRSSGQDRPGPELQVGRATMPSLTLIRTKTSFDVEEEEEESRWASSREEDDDEGEECPHDSRSKMTRPPMGVTWLVRHARSRSTCVTGNIFPLGDGKRSRAAIIGTISPSWTLQCGNSVSIGAQARSIRVGRKSPVHLQAEEERTGTRSGRQEIGGTVQPQPAHGRAVSISRPVCSLSVDTPPKRVVHMDSL